MEGTVWHCAGVIDWLWILCLLGGSKNHIICFFVGLLLLLVQSHAHVLMNSFAFLMSRRGQIIGWLAVA